MKAAVLSPMSKYSHRVYPPARADGDLFWLARYRKPKSAHPRCTALVPQDYTFRVSKIEFLRHFMFQTLTPQPREISISYCRSVHMLCVWTWPTKKISWSLWLYVVEISWAFFIFNLKRTSNEQLTLVWDISPTRRDLRLPLLEGTHGESTCS